MANVYLIPRKDSTYVSCISDDAPSTDAIFLVKEGEYPTTLIYRRHDMNMCAEYKNVTVTNQTNLVDWLDFLGEARNVVTTLWSYETGVVNERLNALFNECVRRKAEVSS